MIKEVAKIIGSFVILVLTIQFAKIILSLSVSIGLKTATTMLPIVVGIILIAKALEFTNKL